MRKPLAFLPLLALCGSAALAHAADRGTSSVTLAGKTISIDYGRPSLAGRDMLAMLQPGQAWRMGADAPTTLKTQADLAFGGAAVPQGEYVLTAKRAADNRWMLVLSADGKAVAEVPMAEQKLQKGVEVLTMELSGQGSTGQFAMKWGLSSLSAAFTAK